MFPSTCVLVLASLMVAGSFAERISNVESPTWGRRTTEGYGFNSGSGSGSGSLGGRSPSFEGDVESVRPSGSSYGSPYDRAVTDSPTGARRYTHTWERSDAPATRSSYLSGFTTQRSAYGSLDRDRDSDSGSAYGTYGSSRRPSYQTDRWGDVVGGERAATSAYGSYFDTTARSVYGSYFDTTARWGSSGGSAYERTSAWGLGRTTPRYGSSGDRESVYGSGSARDAFDRNSAYVRIQAELVKLTNEKGLTSTGAKCDTFGACDTMCYGYIDTERPNAEFPGSRDQKYWPKLFETDDNNSPSFSNANVTREVCGVPYREATFRVYCEDRDTINSNDLINKWDCNIQRDPEGETFATWHSGECDAKFQADKMRLTFRYKIHTVPRLRCDPTKGALTAAGQVTSTTRRSG